MKSLFIFTTLILVISVACAGYKSAGSPTTQNPTPIADPVSTQPVNTTTQGQPTCTLTLSDSPAVNGLRLGMTTDEVLALFPGSKDDVQLRSQLAAPISPFGNSSFVINPSKYVSKEKFSGISQLSFALLDGRVSSYTLSYNGPEYSHVDKFVTKFVEGKNLPAADQWQTYAGLDNQLKVLACTGFEVRVFAGGTGGSQNYIVITDSEAMKRLKDRRRKAREKATPTP